MNRIVKFLFYVLVFFLCCCKAAAPPETDRAAVIHDTITVIRRDTLHLVDTLRLQTYVCDTLRKEENTRYVFRTVRDTFYIDKLSSLTTIRHASADSIGSHVSHLTASESDTLIDRHAESIRIRSPASAEINRSKIARNIKDLIVGVIICFVGFGIITYINKSS